MLAVLHWLIHSVETHKTLRTVIIALAAVFVIRAFVAPGPQPAAPIPVASAAPATAHPISHEAQAAVDTSRRLAQVNGGQVPGYAQPAVRVVHDCFGFLPAQCFAILQGTRPKTAPVMHVGAKLVGPNPDPTPTPGIFSKAQIETMFSVAKSADAAAIGESHIDVRAKLDYAEVPTSRLGALLTPAGSGIGIDLLQRKHLLFIAGAIERRSHVSPVVGLHFKLPHTSLSCGPAVYYDQRLRPQISCMTYF